MGNLKLKNEELWNDFIEKNQDPYGGCCVKVAQRVMELLEEKPEPLQNNGIENAANKLICQADEDVKAGGITGFMAGAVASMVSRCHERGEEFRKSWNNDYDYDGDGVVNPAIITVNVDDEKVN